MKQDQSIYVTFISCNWEVIKKKNKINKIIRTNADLFN